MILNYNSTTIQVNDNCLIPQLVRDGLFGGKIDFRPFRNQS